MCGIFGIISRKNKYNRASIKASLETMHHRGPDQAGIANFELNTDWELWLGHVRLSILDLTELGKQPMQVGSGNHKGSAIVFNGEIYNYREIRKHLQKDWEFFSDADTEVLLAGLCLKGPSFFDEINGMLAAGFFDFQSKQITLVRDRIGKKPLYLYQDEDQLVFASELKAIKS